MDILSVVERFVSSLYSPDSESNNFPVMWVFLGFVVLIMFAFIFGFVKVEDFFCFIQNSGVLGLFVLFIVCLLVNAALFLPTPLYLLLVIIGAVEFLGLGIFSPLLVGIIAATGATIGEFSGYLVGYLGITTFNKMSKSEVYQLKVLKDKLEEMGMPLIIIFSFAPLPFDLVGIVAGLARYSKTKFFIGTWLGKTPKYILIAYAGYFGLGFLLNLFGIPTDYLSVTCTQAVMRAVGV